MRRIGAGPGDDVDRAGRLTAPAEGSKARALIWNSCTLLAEKFCEVPRSLTRDPSTEITVMLLGGATNRDMRRGY